jgi:hypothetical protein
MEQLGELYPIEYSPLGTEELLQAVISPEGLIGYGILHNFTTNKFAPLLLTVKKQVLRAFILTGVQIKSNLRLLCTEVMDKHNNINFDTIAKLRAMETKGRIERGIIASKIQITSVYLLVEGVAKVCVGGELSVDKMGCSVDLIRWHQTHIEFILIPHNANNAPLNPEVEVLSFSADGTRWGLRSITFAGTHVYAYNFLLFLSLEFVTSDDAVRVTKQST